LEKAAVIPNML